ncbi:glycosyltransferase [Corynebacterium sanguinis]|uniref:glycosyltransferase family 2 protein n=1 Tax=Corynebacterium sanguinis TaxID=2594913 RepID=UPI0021A28CA0|nr:glycosyltransferase [Corynebacterium sanguinis]MCT1445370.1 glycosyltransferase [Corynebacterium sanguinis]
MILINGHVVDLIFVIAVLAIAVGLSYMFFMIWLSRTRQKVWKPRDYQPGDPSVIFVLPCLNEEAVIEASLRRLLAMNYPDKHILVIDDGSDDNTAGIVRSVDSPQVHLLQRHLPNARLGKGEALNAAFNHILDGNLCDVTDTDNVIVVVVDADGRMEPESLRYVVPAFEDPALGGVQIGVRINNRADSLLARMQDMEFVLYTEVYQRARVRLRTPGLGGNGQFMRLSTLQTLGQKPWSQSLTEDLDLGVRTLINGYRLDFCPQAAVHQQGLVSLQRWIRQRARWFQGHLQSWSLVGDVLTSLKGIQRVDLFYHLTSPALVITGAFFTVAMLLTALGQVLAIPTGQQGFHLYWLGAYLLAFIPMIILGLIYSQSEPGMSPLRAAGLAHLYVAYSLLWSIAGGKAIINIMLGRRGWAKTERIQESPSEVESAIMAELPRASQNDSSAVDACAISER